MKKRTALITGANGMDAKTLARLLLKKGYRVILTFRRNSLFSPEVWIRETQTEGYRKSIFFNVCDITDQNSVRACVRSVKSKHGDIDEIYMLAAMSHVGYSFTQKEYCVLANGQSYYFFLECLLDISPDTRVYGAMTSELFGGIGEGVFNEKSHFNPKSPYAIGKQLGANWINYYKEAHDIFCCYGLLFNHSNYLRTNDFLIAKVCQAAAKIHLGQQDILKLGNLDFWRDEHWSDFGVEMMWKMLQQDEPNNFVIGNGVSHHGEEFLDNAFNHFNLDWRKYVVLDKRLIRPNEVDKLTADCSLAQEKLGWEPNKMSFKDHISELCNYHLKKSLGQEYSLDSYEEKIIGKKEG